MISHRLKLEFAAEPPHLHSHSPVPLNTLSRCPRSRQQTTADHRQNLHELILRAQGVAFNTTLQGHVTRIEVHNRALTQKSNAIPATARGDMTVGDFHALAENPHIEAATGAAERNFAAGRSADAIRQGSDFTLRGLGIEHDTFHCLSMPMQRVAGHITEAEQLMRLIGERRLSFPPCASVGDVVWNAGEDRPSFFHEGHRPLARIGLQDRGNQRA